MPKINYANIGGYSTRELHHFGGTSMRSARNRSGALATRTLRLAPPDLQPIVDAVTRRAEEQGQLSARQVREELAKANADPRLWKEVLRRAGPTLERRGNHYHFVPRPSPVRERQAELQERIHNVVHDLVDQYRRAAALHDRREADRIAFQQPVSVRLANDEVHQVVTKDISASGMRLLGSRDLLAQKIRVTVPRPEGAPCEFLMRIVWTCRVGDDLYENGGVFLGLVET
jgi:PilZ domain-containing protein